MADNTLRLRAVLDDKVSNGLAKIRDSVNQIGGRGTAASLFGNVGAKAAAFGFGLVTGAADQAAAAIGSAVNAAIEDEQSVAKLGTALRANVPAWDGQTAAIERVLRSRMKLGFSDDEQRESLALLVAATNDAMAALDLQRTAMDLARLKRISLAEASEALVKVEAGQFRMLKSLGIELKNNATQSEAVAAVQKVVAGQAEAYADTTGGKLLVAQTKFNEAMETLGAQLLPVVAKGADALSTAIDGLSGEMEDAGKSGFDLASALDAVSFSWDAVLNVGNVSGRVMRDAEARAAALRDAIGQVRHQFQQGRVQMDRWAADTRSSGEAFSWLGRQVDEAAGHFKGAVRIVRKSVQQIVDEVRDGRQDWKEAWAQFKEDLDNEMTVAEEKAKLHGILVSKRLQRGLKSQDPVLRAQAVATRDIVVKRLQGLEAGAFHWGKKTVVGFIKGMHSQLLALDAEAQRHAKVIEHNLRIRSPAKKGPLSEGGGPEGWGKRLGEKYAKGLSDSLPKLDIGAGRFAGATMGATMGATTAAALGGTRGANRSLSVNLVVDGRTLARVLFPHIDAIGYRELQRAAPTSGRV